MTKHLIFSTNKEPPEEDDDSLYAKFYRKHNFGEIFISYETWGPVKIEVHGYLTPSNRKFIAESMYYLNKPGDSRGEHEKAQREHLETLCDVFKLPLKPRKKDK